MPEVFAANCNYYSSACPLAVCAYAGVKQSVFTYILHGKLPPKKIFDAENNPSSTLLF